MRNRATIALIAVAMVASACGGASEGGVNVKTIATDLTYGVPESPKPAPPANTSTQTTDDLPRVIQGGDPPKQIPTPRGVPTDPCPEAPPTVFPEAAPVTIKGTPTVGTYRWVTEGFQLLPPVGRVRLPGFTQRQVVESGMVDGGPRFVTQEREAVVGSQYDVRNHYEFRAGGLDQTLQGQNVDRNGLYLVKIERIHRTKPGSNTEFNPTPPILVLPQPVVLGDSVAATGVDPGSLEVLRQEGTVTKRVRVDACGKPQDAFYVETFQDFIAADGRVTRRRYNYGIATIMGGLPIVERTVSPCIADPTGACQQDAITFRMDAHIGQLKPNRN